ncbi:hypothetical protein [Paenibacillus azoreducens]|uniref:hypothetical protein n=1 Tax=Paenibacillus azoreducens TaxID=116718 RepID=UPI001BB45689|nr:hypothetical protein [Paenibacillus azoreducens]
MANISRKACTFAGFSMIRPKIRKKMQICGFFHVGRQQCEESRGFAVFLPAEHNKRSNQLTAIHEKKLHVVPE